jgi:hypothetical protein
MSGQSRVDVEVALSTRGESEFPAVNRFALKNFKQLLLRGQCLHVGQQMIDWRQPIDIISFGQKVLGFAT